VTPIEFAKSDPLAIKHGWKIHTFRKMIFPATNYKNLHLLRGISDILPRFPMTFPSKTSISFRDFPALFDYWEPKRRSSPPE